jgi:hypothetical protein
LVIRDLDIPSASPALATAPQKDTDQPMPTGPDPSTNPLPDRWQHQPPAGADGVHFLRPRFGRPQTRSAHAGGTAQPKRLEVILDQWAGADRKDWGACALGHIMSSDFVIIVASPDYQRVGDGVIATTNNPGAQSEAVVIRDQLHHDRPTWTRKLLPGGTPRPPYRPDFVLIAALQRGPLRHRRAERRYSPTRAISDCGSSR